MAKAPPKFMKGKPAKQFPVKKPGLTGGPPKERKALFPPKKRK